jgi:hypothetical protein
MSYIDTINHSFVGTFANLPVYHPLENLDEEGVDEFSATPKNLVIGGGSGEHPGLVIQNLDYCVWDYLETLAEIAGKEPYAIGFYKVWFENLTDDETEQYNAYANLSYKNWGMNEIRKFANNVDKLYADGIQYCTNKKELEGKSVEQKINIMLGEFIFFSAPHLISEDFLEYINEHKESFEKEEIYFSAPFEAVKVSPKGYPNCLGRHLISDGQGGVKTKWGLLFDEESTIDPVLNDPDRNKKTKKPKI